MSGFTSINQFGRLTLENGQRLTFEDFDKNKDGKISEEEYHSVLEENRLDSVQLSTVDQNGDKEISKEEFALWDQKQQMQEAVNDLASEIAIDFAGKKSSYITILTNELKSYMEYFINNYNGEVSGMAESFKAELPEKYEEIKGSVLANDPDTVASKVVNRIINDLQAEKNTDGTNKYSETAINNFAEALDNVAKMYCASYRGADLNTDLNTYLIEWLTKSDSQNLESDVTKYNQRVQSKYGDSIEASEIAGYKECVRQLLSSALEKGIPVKLGEQIVTSNNLSTVLNKYNNGNALKNDVQVFINSLNKTTKLESIGASGSSYRIDLGKIDIASVTKDYGAQIHERGKGWSGSFDKAYAKGEEMLNSETLKNQIKAQFESILSAKGIPFSEMQNIFENTYKMSVSETLNAEGMITGRGARGLSSKGHAYIDTNQLVSNFVEIFNKNISSTIDNMNASTKDYDLQDIDYSVMTRDSDGNPLVDEDGNPLVDPEVEAALQNGKTVSMKKRGADYYKKQAEEMIDRLKPQMLAKAKTMCTANGIAFDNAKFEVIFNSAKKNAVNSSVWGFKAGQNNSTGEQVGVGITMGALGVVTAGTSLAVLGFAALGGLFSGHHSRSFFNPQECIRSFTTEFKENFTAWVNTEQPDGKERPLAA